MSTLIWFLVFVLGALTLAYNRASLLTSTLIYGGGLLAYALFGDPSLPWLVVLWGALAVLVFLNIDALRIRFISRPFLRTYRRMLPSMSQTEKDALEAGTVWWHGELFSGGPDWEKLLSAGAPLSAASMTTTLLWSGRTTMIRPNCSAMSLTETVTPLAT